MRSSHFRQCSAIHHWGRGVNVAYGSKPVRLRSSKCFQVCASKQTQGRLRSGRHRCTVSHISLNDGAPTFPHQPGYNTSMARTNTTKAMATDANNIVMPRQFGFQHVQIRHDLSAPDDSLAASSRTASCATWLSGLSRWREETGADHGDEGEWPASKRSCERVT